MHYRFAMILAIFSLVIAVPTGIAAQEITFKIADRPLEVHGAFSQGFMVSGQNNYLTMDTTSGSFAMTDGAVNVNYRISDKLRIGAQAYDRKVGALGHGKVTLDWALADFKAKSWLGFRGGKVKTTMGLYNDTQDMEFLHTWALLPQSMYPVDLRDSYIAHEGGDIYGDISLKKYGMLSYTAYAGQRPNDLTGGYVYALTAFTPSIYFKSFTGLQVGQDVRWATPVKGLLVGYSHQSGDVNGIGNGYGFSTITPPPGVPAPPPVPDGSPIKETTRRDFTHQFYTQYQHNKLRIDGEYRRYWRDHLTSLNNLPATPVTYDIRSWYVSGAYRVNKWLELGTYHSRYYPDWNETHIRNLPGASDPAAQHIFDWAVTGRVDIKRYWDVKVEGHFMDGYGYINSVRGFYQAQNPSGFQPKTNLLVVRSGFNF